MIPVFTRKQVVTARAGAVLFSITEGETIQLDEPYDLDVRSQNGEVVLLRDDVGEEFRAWAYDLESAEDAAEAKDYEQRNLERCPGCGCEPGDGHTAGCKHPEGCGYYSEPQS